jgi:DnaJ like chaperone protein
LNFKSPPIAGKGWSMHWKVISQAMGLEGAGVRDVLASLISALGLDRLTGRGEGHRSVAFTIAVTTLAAKMAKADGVALPVEAEAFERMFAIPPEERRNLRRLYDLAKQDVAGYDAYAAKIARLLKDDPQLLGSVLECLFHVAAADGVLHPAEDRFLESVAGILGLGRLEYATIRASFVHDPHSPYAILGVAPDVSDAELKARYHALVREHHPDRLAASGVPPEFRAAADRRLAVINAAYEAVSREREQAAAGHKARGQDAANARGACKEPCS